MTKSRIDGAAGRKRARSSSADQDLIALERALEGLFRLGANRRFEARQSAAVGAVVTRAGYAVLRSLRDAGTLTVRMVAEACAMDAATASRQITQLVEEGLVARNVHAEDSRSVALSLTDRGRDVYEAIVRYRVRALDLVVNDWTVEDRATMTTLVTRLADGLAAGAPRDTVD